MGLQRSMGDGELGRWGILYLCYPMKRTYLLLTAIFLWLGSVQSQDTFSIVALDTITGEVGSAGASCVDMDNFPGYDDDFLGELFPGLGAINTQAWYLESNQANARARMNEGYTPSEIIQWLYDNDAQNQPERRQYGIVALVGDHVESAAHTGTQTDDYKNHVLGPNYSIQGNILLGQVVLDSMEARFLAADGDLACKLMAALQGAKMVGADSRCATNGTSSLFAFVKVAQPADTFGSPSFLVSVRTKNGQNIEPIDTLQTLFDLVHDCSSVKIDEKDEFGLNFKLYPNPANTELNIECLGSDQENHEVTVQGITGTIVYQNKFTGRVKLDVSGYSAGLYFIKIRNGYNTYTSKFLKE